MVLYPPLRRYKHVGGRLAHEALHYDVAAQTLEVGYAGVDILVGREEFERLLHVFVGKLRAADNLQLVYLQNVELQIRHYRGLAYVLLTVLAGQSEDDMSAGEYAAVVRQLNGSSAALEVVPTVDVAQRVVIHRLYAVLHDEERAAIQLLQIVEQLRAYAVGTGANHQSNHILNCQCLLVATLQHIERCVGVAVRLKIGKVFHVGILATEERLPLLHLLRNRLRRLTVRRIERAVVAENATAVRYRAVSVRAGEAGVHRDLLHTERKTLTYPLSVVVVWFVFILICHCGLSNYCKFLALLIGMVLFYPTYSMQSYSKLLTSRLFLCNCFALFTPFLYFYDH